MVEHCYCQKINPQDYHEKEHLWKQPRFFYRVTTRMAFHQPFTYNEDIPMAMAESSSKGYVVKENPLILLKSGLFRGELFVEIQPPRDNKECGQDDSCRQLQGRFYSTVVQSPSTRMGKDIDRVMRELKKNGKKVKDIYLCLLTCPACVRKKENQTMIIAHLQ